VDSIEVSAALVEWTGEVCPAINATYDRDPTSILDALPIATAAISDESVVAGDTTLGIPLADLAIEQADVHVFRSTIFLMVEPEPDDDASHALQGFVRDLGAAIKADQTLGGRVQSSSKRWSANYDPPFVEFDDGTKARVASFTVVITELT
jgi:hypothetical protein